MARGQQRQGIPVKLSDVQFEEFVLPHLTHGGRGPAPKLPLRKIFNYILKVLYLGCQWKELPIEKDQAGCPEIHRTSVYRAFRHWQAHVCTVSILFVPASSLHPSHLPNTSIIPSNSTTTPP